MDAWLEQERGRTVEQLMAVAGLRVAQAARELVEARDLQRVVALVGPGNNGGDVLCACEHLREELPVTIVRPFEGDAMPELDARTLVLDGLFGVGLARPITGAARAAVDAVNQSGAYVLAVDVPSGLSADDGSIVGVTRDDPDGGVAMRADVTVTFVGRKRGFARGQGPALVGAVRVVDLGFPIEEADAWLARRRAGAR